jgi:hypothetical protein
MRLTTYRLQELRDSHAQNAHELVDYNPTEAHHALTTALAIDELIRRRRRALAALVAMSLLLVAAFATGVGLGGWLAGATG